MAAHPLVTFVAVGPLQVMGLTCAMWGVQHGPGQFPEGRIWRFFSNLYGLILVLGVGSFMWLFLPAAAIDTKEGWNVFSFVFLTVLFGSLLGYGLILGVNPPSPLPFRHRVVTALGVFAFLAVSNSLLGFAAGTGKQAGGLFLVAGGLSYLPFRLLLVLRPPWSLLELGTALGTFGFLVARFL